jgi:cell division protein FtsB
MKSFNANLELAQLKEEYEKLKTRNITLEKELELKSKEDDM